MAFLIDGKEIAKQIKDEVKERVSLLNAQGQRVCLAVIQVGEDPASSVYVRNKQKACEYVGIISQSHALPEVATQTALLDLIQKLNQDPAVTGILVQLPLPAQMNEEEVIRMIDPKKDVDGFHPENVGRLLVGAAGLRPCTPAGIIELLKRTEITIDGKECVIVGRSNIVGKPAGLLLLQENGTVTLSHSRTKNLKEITARADILIVAMGRPEFITNEYVKEGAVVIDVGIHRDRNNKLCGDVDFAGVKDRVSAITPVPGGVGPMTVAMLMHNCVEALMI